MEDVHGIRDTQRSRYEQVWRRWRKQVKKYERIARVFASSWGVPCPKIQLPGTWAVDWEHSELQRHEFTRDMTPKASRGMRVSAAREFGARDLIMSEAHHAIDLALDMPTDEQARAECVRVYTLMKQQLNRVGQDECNLLVCADLMAQPVPQARAVEAPFNWYHSKHGLAWSNNNFTIEHTGEVKLHYDGLEVQHRQAKMEKHDRFARQHGWHIKALEYRGHGAGFKDQHRERAIQEALELVREGRVPMPKRKRGRPRVTWVVLTALAERGVSSCVHWQGMHAHDEIIDALLDTAYAKEVDALT